eukprot:XP_001706364.1 Hypothetical protein GL50803_37605 [Giardia lamblia ATCC 50803]
MFKPLGELFVVRKGLAHLDGPLWTVNGQVPIIVNQSKLNVYGIAANQLCKVINRCVVIKAHYLSHKLLYVRGLA